MTDKRMTQKQELLLNQLSHVSELEQKVMFLPNAEDIGKGMRMRLRRLIKYRGAYLGHIWDQIKDRLKDLIPEKDLRARTFWGKELLLPSRDSNAQTIYKSGALDANEKKLLQFFINTFQDSDVFYDIGANYGFYTALAEKLISRGEVHAFEPGKEVFRYLKSSFSGNPQIFLNNVALSSANGHEILFDCYEGHSSGKSTTVREVAADHRWHYKPISVPTITLDEYSQYHKSPSIIKIDVEGAESMVLEGGIQILKRTSPLIAIELWSGKDLAVFSFKALTILEKVGYVPFFITPTGTLKTTSYSYLKDFLSVQKEETNFIFKKINKIDTRL